MSEISNPSSVVHTPPLPETTLFGEVPASDSDNNSTTLHLSKSSNMSDDGEDIRISDLDEDNENGDIVNTKNYLNSDKGIINDVTGISPYNYNINGSKDSVAVIDIDGDGKYYKKEKYVYKSHHLYDMLPLLHFELYPIKFKTPFY